MINTKKLFYFLIIPQFIFALQNLKLDEISITANNVSSKKSTLNKSDIKKGLVFNERDLVRNETGISVTEGGRSANNGYAIRGVDSDRISLKIDGFEAAQSFMPRFYYLKGFMNANRSGTELENISGVEFIKGANSLTKGSGAIGGSVAMHTKSIDDFVASGDTIGVYTKSGYASKNNEFRQVTGAGISYNGFETLFQYTYKKGKETKNYYSGKYTDIPFCGLDTNGVNLNDKYPHLCSFGRILPDSVNFTSNSRLFKFGYRFLDSHFLNSFYEDFRQSYFTEEKSNSTAALNRKSSKDAIPYKRYGVYYEYTPITDEVLSYFKAGISKQKVLQRSEITQYNAYGGSYAKLNNKPQTIRKFNFFQDRLQFDLSGTTREFNILDLDHIFSFGAGRYCEGV